MPAANTNNTYGMYQGNTKIPPTQSQTYTSGNRITVNGPSGPAELTPGPGMGKEYLFRTGRLDPYDPMSEMLAMQERMMGEQMAMQERFNAQQMALQQQQMDLAREQMAMQEQATQFANQESSKTPSDYVQVNAADTKRKQLLRRGLMSTFTRYPSSASGGAAKAEKLGG